MRTGSSKTTALRAGLLALGAVLSLDLAAAVLRVGPGETFVRIADAAKSARDGDIVEIMPGEYRGDVAVWKQERLLIRGLGERPVLIADGRVAEGKAIWVIRNGDIQVENIEFRGARAGDGNGAGIRFERGRLEVRNSTFIDNQIGILTANFEDAELTIHDSLFAQAPRQERPLPHLLYVGRIARFEISGSRFHQGYHGHLLKSRARYNDIRYNLLYDGPHGEASYELELPNGGVAFVVGNIIGQSANTQNPIVIAYGAEGNIWPDSALYLSHNTLLSDRLAGTWFLRTFSDHLPPDAEILGINNITAGIGAFTLTASGTFTGNVPLPPGGLRDPDTLDFLPRGSSLLRWATKPAGSVRSISLAPEAEFALPRGTRPLPPLRHWLPGALQSGD
ncbi:hypothetical protein C666_00100 [Thauera linaloolentis 47Lol = DSM 12138]|uniref:Right handed beta helix domain-containing protein n=1 Tax=Thauera linaloolentis (strain DSM 12138 / JCM 21573 / CCUG 41526 / CIP 105981 / IAM 15112 / NBRC 102519 / 47Lol) TaxID=1123367 RepID=N6YGD6_THAL4|nr:hypothetical protein C666_00100 [Thauera linaloolentis 47Lol = DSM 12138]